MTKPKRPLTLLTILEKVFGWIWLLGGLLIIAIAVLVGESRTLHLFLGVAVLVAGSCLAAYSPLTRIYYALERSERETERASKRISEEVRRNAMRQR